MVGMERVGSSSEGAGSPARAHIVGIKECAHKCSLPDASHWAIVHLGHLDTWDAIDRQITAHDVIIGVLT